MNASGYTRHIPSIPSVVKCDKRYAIGTSISKILVIVKIVGHNIVPVALIVAEIA